MNDPSVPDLDVEPGAQRAVVSRIMRRQARLSLQLAGIFILILIALPLFNLYFPKVAQTEIAGFSLTWLILGVLFFPLTWILSAYFVRTSESVEAAIVAEYRKPKIAPSQPNGGTTES